MNKKIIGFWQEYGWSTKDMSIHNDIPKYSPGTYKSSIESIEYLEKGIFIIGARMAIYCIFTGKNMVGPMAVTDGIYLWTKEYAHYVREGVMDIPDDFLSHMQANNFRVPSRDDIGTEKLEILIQKIQKL
jgi:hypothetical protein